MLRTVGRRLLHRAPSRQAVPIVAYPRFLGNGTIRRLPRHHHALENRFVSVKFQSSLQFTDSTPSNNNRNASVGSNEKQPPPHDIPFSTALLLPAHQQRPVTAWERVRYFPANLLQLWQDYLRYQNILDAANSTPQNSWTLRQHVVLEFKDANDSADISKSKTDCIPRRQYQQMRQFQQDLHTVLPIVVLSAPPIIGYFPLLFAIAAPRQVLSRQFHNEYEIWTFGQLEYRQRQEHMRQLAQHPMGKALLDRVHEMIRDTRGSWMEDAAGPLLDLSSLHSAVFPEHGERGVLSKGQGRTSTLLSCLPRRNEVKLVWNQVPRDYLVQLALANGVFSQYPSWMSQVLISGCTRQWLVRQLRDIATTIRRDDIMLLEEGYDMNGCQSLTDQELLDACLMRGLPVSVSLDEMRLCLTNHLQMVKAWVEDRSSVNKSTRNDELELLLLLHITPLRHQLKEK